MTTTKSIKAKLNLVLAHGFTTLTCPSLLGRIVYPLEEKKEKTKQKTEANISLKGNKASHNFKSKETMKLILKIILLLVFTTVIGFSQEMSIDGEFRINPLYSMGFRKPLYAGDKSGFSTMQRSRLILSYKKENDILSEIVLQDRRYWGDQSDRDDIANMVLYRGWVEKFFAPGFSLRLGRQGLVYDDQYLLGDPNWAGTRAHDLGLVKYESKIFKAHLGVAFNANGQEFKAEPYMYNMYKNMEFLWLHKDFNNINLSFIGINRAVPQNTTTTNLYYSQTFGPDINIKIMSNLSLKGLYYYQMGKSSTGKDVSAYFYSAQIIYKPAKFLEFNAGLDMGSGTNQSIIKDPENKKSHSFERLYGLIHGQFGYIDYFYVNQPTLCGIKDYYLKAKIKMGSKFSIENHTHYFETAAKINDSKNPGATMNNYLGTENDFTLNYNFASNFKAGITHCIMFGSRTLDEFFGGKTSVNKQVIYVVISANTNFFKFKKEQTKENK